MITWALPQPGCRGGAGHVGTTHKMKYLEFAAGADAYASWGLSSRDYRSREYEVDAEPAPSLRSSGRPRLL